MISKRSPREIVVQLDVHNGCFSRPSCPTSHALRFNSIFNNALRCCCAAANTLRTSYMYLFAECIFKRLERPRACTCLLSSHAPNCSCSIPGGSSTHRSAVTRKGVNWYPGRRDHPNLGPGVYHQARKTPRYESPGRLGCRRLALD